MPKYHKQSRVRTLCEFSEHIRTRYHCGEVIVTDVRLTGKNIRATLVCSARHFTVNVPIWCTNWHCPLNLGLWRVGDAGYPQVMRDNRAFFDGGGH